MRMQRWTSGVCENSSGRGSSSRSEITLVENGENDVGPTGSRHTRVGLGDSAIDVGYGRNEDVEVNVRSHKAEYNKSSCSYWAQLVQ